MEFPFPPLKWVVPRSVFKWNHVCLSCSQKSDCIQDSGRAAQTSCPNFATQQKLSQNVHFARETQILRFCPKTICTGFLQSLRIWAKPRLLRENSKTPIVHKMAKQVLQKMGKNYREQNHIFCGDQWNITTFFNCSQDVPKGQEVTI